MNSIIERLRAKDAGATTADADLMCDAADALERAYELLTLVSREVNGGGLSEETAHAVDLAVQEHVGSRVLPNGWFRIGADGKEYPVQPFALRPGEDAEQAVQNCFPGQKVFFRNPLDAYFLRRWGALLRRLGR